MHMLASSIVEYFKDNPLYFYCLLAIVALLAFVIAVIILSKVRKRRGLPFPEIEDDDEETDDEREDRQASADTQTPETAKRSTSTYSGKWIITRNADGTFEFELRASNGEHMLASNQYSSLQGAKAGIQTYKANIERGNFQIAQDKNRKYYFSLLSASKQLLCKSSAYSSRTSCENAIESDKRYAMPAPVLIIRENNQ